MVDSSGQCFVAHSPVGERCSHAQVHHDGRPPNSWNLSIAAARDEIHRLHNNQLDPRLTDAEHAEYAGQLAILMKKAARGVVSMRIGGEGKVIRDRIVELIPKLQQRRAAFGRRPRLVRLYLGEPASEASMLLALRLSTKEDSEGGLIEQDSDITMALQRAEAWCLAGSGSSRVLK